jgi:hypothetical protein
MEKKALSVGSRATVKHPLYVLAWDSRSSSPSLFTFRDCVEVRNKFGFRDHGLATTRNCGIHALAVEDRKSLYNRQVAGPRTAQKGSIQTHAWRTFSAWNKIGAVERCAQRTWKSGGIDAQICSASRRRSFQGNRRVGMTSCSPVAIQTIASTSSQHVCSPGTNGGEMLSISVHRFRHFSTFSERIVQPQRFCSMPRTFSMHGFEYFPSVQFSDLRLADCTATSDLRRQGHGCRNCGLLPNHGP